MLIFHGEQLYGKVDHVPGHFHVATRFFYVQFLPLLPLGSVIVVEEPLSKEGWQNQATKFSLKSVLMAWFRAALVIVGPILIIVGMVELADRKPDRSFGAGMICTGVCLFGLNWFTYRITCARPDRALAIGTELGVPPERLAQAFAGK